MGCDYAPNIDEANKMMLQKKEKFDYLISVSERLESKFYQFYYILDIDYYSNSSIFSLSEMERNPIKVILFFELDKIGTKELENNDSFKKYMSADLFPMFDSVIQIRKELNCRNINIYRHAIYIEYLSWLGDSTFQIIHYNEIDKSTAPVKPNRDVHENDTLNINQNDTPSKFPLNQENWYYFADKALHGIT